MDIGKILANLFGKSQPITNKEFEELLQSAPILVSTDVDIESIDKDLINNGSNFILLDFNNKTFSGVIDFDDSKNVNENLKIFNFITSFKHKDIMKALTSCEINTVNGYNIKIDYAGSDEFYVAVKQNGSLIVPSKKIKNPTDDFLNSLESTAYGKITNIELMSDVDVISLDLIDVRTGRYRKLEFINLDARNGLDFFVSLNKLVTMSDNIFRNNITKIFLNLDESELNEIENIRLNQFNGPDIDGNLFAVDFSFFSGMDYREYISLTLAYNTLISKNRETLLKPNSPFIKALGVDDKDTNEILSKYGFSKMINKDEQKSKSYEIYVDFSQVDDNAIIEFAKGFGLNPKTNSFDAISDLLNNVLEESQVNVLSGDEIVITNVKIDKKTSTKVYYFLFNTTMGMNDDLGYDYNKNKLELNKAPSNRFKDFLIKYPNSSTKENQGAKKFYITVRK